jgi:heme/copper-type cytochrome/quinol oxidase subunit 1
VVNFVWSYFRGKLAGNDPWDAWTLEWATASPPPCSMGGSNPGDSNICAFSHNMTIKPILTHQQSVS